MGSGFRSGEGLCLKMPTTTTVNHGTDDALLDSIYVMLAVMVVGFVLYSVFRLCSDGEMVLMPRRFFKVGADGLRDSLRTITSPIRRRFYGNWIYKALAASEDYLLKEVCLH